MNVTLRHYEVVLLEPCMMLNLMASVSRAGARELQREAAASIAWLRLSDRIRDSALEAFEAVFLKVTPRRHLADHGNKNNTVYALLP